MTGYDRLWRALQIQARAEAVLERAMRDGRALIGRHPAHETLADEIAASLLDLAELAHQQVDLTDTPDGWIVALTPIYGVEVEA